jgi:4-hydroxybenzoate polyprenyltransferase
MIIRGGTLSHTGTSALRLLHYWWPFALGWSLTVVVERATGETPHAIGRVALLSGILAAYSLDRVVDPAAARMRPWMLWLLASGGIVSAVTCATAAWRLPIQTAVLVPALGVVSLLYPRLKRAPITKTAVLPLIWTWACIALPFNDASWFGWRAMLQPVAMPILLLIGAGCLLCDLKDEDGDRRSGVRSLPAMFGGTATVRAAAIVALTAAAVAMLEHRPGLVVSAAVLGMTTWTPKLLASEAAGPLLVDVILTLPGLLIATRVF